MCFLCFSFMVLKYVILDRHPLRSLSDATLCKIWSTALPNYLIYCSLAHKGGDPHPHPHRQPCPLSNRAQVSASSAHSQKSTPRISSNVDALTIHAPSYSNGPPPKKPHPRVPIRQAHVICLAPEWTSQMSHLTSLVSHSCLTY